MANKQKKNIIFKNERNVSFEILVNNIVQRISLEKEVIGVYRLTIKEQN